MTTKLAELQDRVQELQLEQKVQQLETVLENDKERKSILMENWGDFVNPLDIFRGESDLYPSPGAAAFTRASDRANGDNFPLWRTEQELHLIRGICRYLGQMNTGAIGPMAALKSYIVGTGYNHKAQAKKDAADQTAAENAAEAVQKVIDDCHKDNCWRGDLEEESFTRQVRDGELWLRLTADSIGRVTFDVYEPEWITQPLNASEVETFYGLPELDWKYGIASTPGRATETVGYFALNNGDPTRGEFIPANEMIFCKRNVDRNVKRGASDFYPGRELISKALTLLDRIIDGGTIQASIALIRKWSPKIRNTQIQGAADADVQYEIPARGSAATGTKVRRFFAGTVIDDKGADYEMGAMGQSHATDFLEIEQGALRAFNRRWVMPEFFTGDASNQNKASSITAHTPFVILCQAEQMKSVNRSKEMDWKVVDAACIGGLLPYDPQALRLLIDINVEPPDVAPDDDALQHAIRKDLNEAGILSLHHWAEQEGLDYDEERALIETEPQPVQPQAIGPDGQPVQDPFGKKDPVGKATKESTTLTLKESTSLADRCLELLTADLSQG